MGLGIHPEPAVGTGAIPGLSMGMEDPPGTTCGNNMSLSQGLLGPVMNIKDSPKAAVGTGAALGVDCGHRGPTIDPRCWDPDVKYW